MTLRRSLFWATLLLLTLRPSEASAEPPRLTLEGRPVALESALTRAGDGSVWIGRADLQRAFAAHAKQLIPRQTDGTRRRQRGRKRAWILCTEERCGTYRGEARGSDRAPAFELQQAAKALGFRLKQDGATYDLTPPERRAPQPGLRRARLGTRVSNLALRFRDGKTRDIHGARGRRLLIVTWASWSLSRKRIGDWLAAVAVQGRRELDVWLVALDVEGEARVQPYAPTDDVVPVAIDRNADLTRLFRLDEVGRWFLLDELGLLRAEGRDLDDVDRLWLDEHFKEDLATDVPPARARADRVELSVLRERVAAASEDVHARLALAEWLADVPGAEAVANARALAALRPESVAFAFRLTRALLDAGDRLGALGALDAARRRAPRMWTLRKQYWALAHPDRFYTGPIDLAWQKAQRKKEREWLDPPGARPPKDRRPKPDR